MHGREKRVAIDIDVRGHPNLRSERRCERLVVGTGDEREVGAVDESGDVAHCHVNGWLRTRCGREATGNPRVADVPIWGLLGDARERVEADERACGEGG